VAESTPMRPQPPSIEDPVEGDSKPWAPGKEGSEFGKKASAEPQKEDKPDWKRRAKDALRFSTTYLDSNLRRQFDDSLRAFNNEHPSDSKYNTEGFRKRSNLFVPKTRAVIRKNEAAGAAAFFSNQDTNNVAATNQADRGQLVSADLMKNLLQYRLTHTVPWFHIVQGGLQDAQTMGATIAHAYWKYETKRDEDGKLAKKTDQPCVELVALENFRFDPSASWVDPINTSPYNIHLIPMYVGEVKEKMSGPNPKGQRWYHYDDTYFRPENPDDSTRTARLGQQQDPTQQKRSVSDYDVVWVHRHIHRYAGTDYEWYMLESEHFLTDPEPLEKTVFHGKRPYVMGVCILETHKPVPTSVPKLVKGLQDDVNELKNQRFDNVRFVLNKRWFAKRGKNVDLASLVRNTPGGITLLDDPEGDVREITWPDVTASAYQEEDRNTQSFDDLIGNFSSSSIQMARSAREPARAMTMLQAPANILTEYLLKTYAITFVEPLLRQLVLLEQHYETDDTVLAIAGEKSKLFQRFGIDRVTDDMLDRELTTTVNVGMGATDPVTKLQRFMMAMTGFSQIAQKPPPGVNLEEVLKEICALSGYQDGERFTMGANPEMMKLQATIKALMTQVQQLKMHAKDKHEANVVKLVTAREKNHTELAKTVMQHKHENTQLYAEHLMGLGVLEKEGDQKSMLSTQDAGEASEQAEQSAKLAPKPAAK
jgi:hypothetical protein